MELKSFLKNISFPVNKEFQYGLSAGLMGTGGMKITYGHLGGNEYIVHVQATAGLKLLPKFHFEGISHWEKSDNNYDFTSYEEKDFAKQIHKKYEITTEGLNYIENKKGLILEREVQYFSKPEGVDRVFDPMSAATLVPLELEEGDEKPIFIFGKQRIMCIKAQKQNGEMKIRGAQGTNAKWEEALSSAKLYTQQEGLIEAIEVPLPIGIGKVKLTLQNLRDVSTQEVKNKVEEFSKGF